MSTAGGGAAQQADDALAEILNESHTIAVVGIKDRPGEDAYRIPRYMQDHGYRIVPVNPKLNAVLGEDAYASLTDVDAAGIEIDLVNLFRASDHVAAHVEEIVALAIRPQAVWMQLGIHHGPSAARLREAGIRVVQDRCIMVDHRRLVAGETGSS
ncbi:MAG: CoA-binding protein [Deltaproteobacteria bacterium]|nr:CoA-binding protein [Deltaproteobacteria bacterium]MBW2384668.1 CoA-binding protein [Deltaproteobacteria bacterium]MBW2696417.1 CoA-binding protein [Deltaproteobacteria bacterium]